MLELQNVLKLKISSLKIVKIVVLRKISGTFVFEKITSTPLSPTFSRKIFCFTENFFLGGGPGMEGGPNLGIHPPPTGNRLARP